VSVFDDMERTDIEPSGHLISRADYLNASARPEAAQVRNQVDAMLGRYPEAHRIEIVRRIRSRDDRLHRSALFELTLHELLIRQGFTIIAIEPQLPGGRAPDFLVEAPDATRLYLEATLAMGEIGADPGADRRMREVLQAIDDVDSPDFFLSLHPRGRPDQPVAVAKLRRQIQAWVNGLDHEAVVADFAAHRPLPSIALERHGLRIIIEALPKNTRSRAGRAIGGRMLAGGQVNPHLAIKVSVEGKGGHYGDLDLPLVVAVNALDEFANVDSAIDALFGTDAVVVDANGGMRNVRNPDGAWRGPGGPVYTRVSAVLSTERLSAWDLTQRSIRLILNPWAARPLADIPLRIAVHRVADGRLTVEPGETLAALLGLPAGWPE
jgi:hypothetical protein